MTTQRNLFMDIFLNILIFMLVYGIFLAPAVIFLDAQPVGLLGMMLGAFSYLFIARRFIKPVIPMFLAHVVLLFAAWFFATGVLYTVAYMVVTVAFVVYSLFRRYRRGTTFTSEFTFFAPITLITLALVLVYLGHGHLVGPYTGMIIAICVGTRLHMRMFQVNASLEVITQSSDQHIQNILTFDHKTMLFLGLILVGMILLLNTLIITPLLDVISTFRPNFQVDIAPDEYEHDMIWNMGMEGGMGFPPELMDYVRGPALIWRILEWIVLYVGMPALGLAVLYLILTKIRNLFNLWRLRKNPDSEIRDEFADVKEFIRKPKAKTRWWNRGKEHKIRRLFRETITRHIKKGAPIIKTDTPDEMTGKITIEDITTLTEEYAIVRYR
ncbi:MAG: hypothetical protein FWC73_04725 [Defluviitaleaceae bacterium]|nr:hypothetical protein [Defluviitaleaceae bacterium]